MTTNVTVNANCDPKTEQVRVTTTTDIKQEDITILQDGEAANFAVYDGKEITVREVLK